MTDYLYLRMVIVIERLFVHYVHPRRIFCDFKLLDFLLLLLLLQQLDIAIMILKELLHTLLVRIVALLADRVLLREKGLLVILKMR